MMKRNYVTPAIAVEYYDLTQSIAACVTKINFESESCVLMDSDSTQGMKDLVDYFSFFLDCENIPIGMTEEDGACYHTNANAAFTS